MGTLRRCLPLIVLVAVVVGVPAAADASIRSAVDSVVPHAYGRLLGVVPRHGTALRALPALAAPVRSGRLHAAPVDVGQPPPPGNPTVCPPNPSSPPFPLCYYGGPVLHSNSVYTVFWQPSQLPGGVSPFSSSYVPVVNGFFHNVAAAAGANNVYQTDAQYYDSTGSAANASRVGGTIVDTNAFPANLGLLGGCPPDLAHLISYCVTDNQLISELDAVINAQGWPRGLGPAYMVFLPQGVSVCAADVSGPACSYDVFCAYHSAYAANGGSPVLYGVLPYAAVPGCDTGQHPNASDADPVLDVASHEHNEIVTDPLGTGWLDLQGNENGDKCARNYGSPLGNTANGQYNQVIANTPYYIQSEFSNAAGACAFGLADKPPTVDFSPPAAVVGQAATFAANAADADGTIAGVAWNFGDGATATGATATHTYATVGTYTVSVSAVDNVGLATITSHQVSVVDARHAASAAALKAFGLSPRQSVRTALRSGLRITIRCRARCSVLATAKLGATALGHASTSLGAAGATHLVIHLSAAARRRLRAGRAVTLTLVVKAAGLTSTKTVRLR